MPRKVERDAEFPGYLAGYVTDAARFVMRAGKLPTVVSPALYNGVKASYPDRWNDYPMAAAAPLPTA